MGQAYHSDPLWTEKQLFKIDQRLTQIETKLQTLECNIEELKEQVSIILIKQED